MAFTAEPLPTRLTSLALGTGDLDCVYHFALPELREGVGSGDRFVVDFDLEKFFARVNHDVLMARVARRVKDK